MKRPTAPTEGRVSITGLIPGQPVRVRLTAQGPGGAQFDAVLLDGQAPIAVQGALLKKLVKADLDVTNAHGRTIEVTFAPIPATSATLTLLGRIEPKVLPTTPLHFPAVNTRRPMTTASAFYTYRLGEQPGRMTVEGQLKNEHLGKPFFTDRQPVDSGHPQGATYGWVRDDGQTLYVAIDFTPDNTYDGEADYTKVYVKVGAALREFKVSVSERRWGRAGFTYTDKVAYQHKVYEFAIPLSEIGMEAAARGTQLSLAFAGYGTVSTPDSQLSPAIAYDATHNQYLMVFSFIDSASTIQVYGLRLDASGAPIGALFPINSQVGSSRYNPSVAYDPQSGRFLVAWTDYRPVTNSDIWAQFVGADGSLVGTEFSISTDTGNEYTSRIANDPVTGRFLVVWGNDSLGTSDISGALLSAQGTVVKTRFPISSAALDQYTPGVAYESTSGRYVVAWNDGRNTNTDIFGQIVTADGDLFDPDGAGTGSDLTNPLVNIEILVAANAQQYAAVAATGGKALVAWHDNADFSMAGQFLDGTGALLGSAIDISTVSSNKQSTAATADPVTNGFRVAWSDYRGGPYNEIFGQALDSTGALVGSTAAANLQFIPTGTASQYNPTIAANPYCGNAVVAAEESTAVYTVPIATLGTCTPAYALVSFAPGSSAGVTAGGGAGQATTFQVTWWGANLPTTAQLWIDLDRNGTAGGTVTRGWPIEPADGAGWAALAAVLGLLLAAWTRRRTVLAGALALGLLSGGLAACSGGGGGGGGGDDSAAVTEKFTLTEVSAADTNPVDGKDYAVTITIPTSGSYAYKYVFSDGTTAAIGTPATGGTVTVD